MRIVSSIGLGHFPGFIMGALTLLTFTCDAASTKNEPAAVVNMQSAASAWRVKPPEWHAPTYQGLVLGKSTKADVERVFSKPIWSGASEEASVDDGEDEILYEYENVGGVVGQTTVVLGAHTKVVKAIGVYPRQPLAPEQIISQYGRKYVERESKLGPCPTEAQLSNYKPAARREYPIFLVYPQQGLYVAVSRTNTVSHIGYLFRCP